MPAPHSRDRVHRVSRGRARLICPSICLLELAHSDFQIMGSGVMAQIFDLKPRSSSFPIRSSCCRCTVKD